MQNRNTDSREKNQVIETVIDILAHVTGFIEREEVTGATHPAKDLFIDTDDLSLFIADLEKHFGVEISQREWSSIEGTIESVAGLIFRHLSKQAR